MKTESAEWKAWVYADAAKNWPEIGPHSFCFDDPWLLCDHLIWNECKIHPKSGDKVMDIGANRGIITLMCAVRGAQVVAYEPSPVAYDILTDTIRRNLIEKQVVAINAAVGPENGLAMFQYGEPEGGDRAPGKVVNGHMASFLPGNYPLTKEVPVLSFNEAVGTEYWDIVKIDVEGYEFEILQSASDESLNKIKYLTVEFHYDRPSSILEYGGLISRLETHFHVEGIKNSEGRYQAFFGTLKN